MIKHLYTFFIGILLATFVGVGVAAFYEAPKSPDYPLELSYPVEKPTGPTESQIQYEKASRTYQTLSKIYARNISIITLSFSVIILVVSLTLLAKLQLISDGLLLGGLFTQIYSIMRGFESQDNKFRFMVVTVGLITSLTIGYLKFIRNTKS